MRRVREATGAHGQVFNCESVGATWSQWVVQSAVVEACNLDASIASMAATIAFD